MPEGPPSPAPALGQPMAWNTLTTSRGDLPEGAECYRTIGPFTAQSLPAGLRAEHRLKDGTWGVVELLTGSLQMVWDDEAGGHDLVTAPARLVVPPCLPHHVEGDGPFELTISFYRVSVT